jgi:hypothetical protein
MLADEGTDEQHPAGGQDPAGRVACAGRVARRALAGIRIVNGGVALLAPGFIIRQFGESPEKDNAAVYGLRMFGVRTVLIGLDLVVLSGAARRRALGQAVIIHASDTASAAALGLTGRVKPRTAVTLTLISATNTGLAVTAYLASRRGESGEV